ncbi:MAG: ABC transporter ATP-binding protein [Acidobacteriota bacterium]|nr:ABC transporter ATP-binding protein [Acidobacteriota bacterium]
MEYAVESFQLEKSFVKKRSVRDLLTRPFRRAERIHAVRGVDLRVRRGEILGLLGPNGAGKTTLLKMFSCLVLPDRGRALVGGEDTVNESKVKPKIGLVHSDERSFYWRLSGRENLRFFSRLYDVPTRKIKSRIEELLDRVDMTRDGDRRFSDYSSGMKQRLAIARALLHDPPILLMDEPTRSLDPISTRELRTFIKNELQERDGKTILLATHDLREAEVLSDRVAILVKGKIRELGTVREVRRWGISERRFRIEVAAWRSDVAGPFSVVANEPHDGGRRVTVALDGDVQLDDVLRAIMSAGTTIHSVDGIEPDLEEAFSRILDSEDDGGDG